MRTVLVGQAAPCASATDENRLAATRHRVPAARASREQSAHDGKLCIEMFMGCLEWICIHYVPDGADLPDGADEVLGDGTVAPQAARTFAGLAGKLSTSLASIGSLTPRSFSE